ncbi:4834_t:CDS:2 [Ambispora leptoticha]|uniref:4834_t:CDS:1 n=1 Tax=Ambispora leptoticha TaxID=144679 RepID=A0A9N8WMF9_9GLOM|nr:4834_t:CDS:2 [Ambispora leptoticha]
MAADFWASTHGRHWLLDKKTLQESRKIDLQFISEIELAKLRIWYANLIHNLGKKLNVKQFQLDLDLTKDLVLGFFFNRNTYRQTDPNLVAATCMYLACKMEESPHHIKNVISEMRNTAVNSAPTLAPDQATFPYDNQKVAEMEFYLLEELDFNLIVFHPYRTLITLAQELGQRQETIREAWTIVNDTYKTDLCLTHPPHMIAIAALYIPIAIRLGECGLSGELKKWFYNLNVDMEEVAVIVQEIISLYELWNTYNDDQIPKIFEKLRTSATAASSTDVENIEEVVQEIGKSEELDDNNNQDISFRNTFAIDEEIDQELLCDDKDYEFALNLRRKNNIAIKQEPQSGLTPYKIGMWPNN